MGCRHGNEENGGLYQVIIKLIGSSVSDPDPLYFDLPDPDPNPFHETDLNTYPNSKKSPEFRKK